MFKKAVVLIIAILVLIPAYFAIGFMFNIRPIVLQAPEKYRYKFVKRPSETLVFDSEKIRFSYLKLDGSQVTQKPCTTKCSRIRKGSKLLGFWHNRVLSGDTNSPEVLKAVEEWEKLDKEEDCPAYLCIPEGNYKGEDFLIRIDYSKYSEQGQRHFYGVGGYVDIFVTSRNIQEVFGQEAKEKIKEYPEYRDRINPEKLTLEAVAFLEHSAPDIRKMTLKNGGAAIIVNENYAYFTLGDYLFIANRKISTNEPFGPSLTHDFDSFKKRDWHDKVIDPEEMEFIILKKILDTIEVKANK